MFIDANVQHERFAEAKRYGALACIECGCCAYICPAKRPLVQSIRVAKKIIREKKI
jgi:electron transport complex protein RnfC